VKRIVQSELLDTLPPDDPRAVHSRRDLRRLNDWMRNHVIMADALQGALNRHAPGQITELGAGDGNFLLQVAQKLSPDWPNVMATLIDLQKNVSKETLVAFADLSWRAEAVVADVFHWPKASTPGGAVIANLFLHHFENAPLATLLRLISQRANIFIALEPSRSRWSVFCSRLLWIIGCNDVTRHDAAISVRAGFSGQELSLLWPNKQNWRLTEQRAGAFSHLFIAQKIS
jgi:hypothetical protein